MHLEHSISGLQFLQFFCHQIWVDVIWVQLKIIMLRTLSVLIAPLHESLKPAHSHQLQILSQKLIKQKIQLKFCEQFQKTKKLPQHFNDKTYQNFSPRDVYFYLINKQKFAMPNIWAFHNMIRSNNLDCFSRFVIADQTRSVKTEEVQKMLMGYFNQTCLDMEVVQFIQCLKIMGRFDRLILDCRIDYQKMKTRIQQEGKTGGENYIEILFLTKQLEIIQKVIDEDQATTNLTAFSESVGRVNTSIKYLYFLDELQSRLSIQPSSTSLKNRQKQISTRITSSKTDQQLLYSIKIIDRHLQYIYLISTEKLNCQLYKKYLQLIQRQAKQNQNFLITHHLLPARVIQTASINQFKGIIKLRVQLELTQVEDLGKLVKKILEYNPDVLLGLLKYMVEEEVADYKPWLDLEIGFIQKLHLNTKNKAYDIKKISKNFNIQIIFKILGYMSISKLGSINFWKPCHRFVFQVMVDDQNIPQMDHATMNSFIISVYEIFQFNTMPDAIQNKLKDLALVSLVNHDWKLSELYKLTKCMTFSKYVCPQIWYAIESKLLLMFNHGAPSHSKIKLAMIIQYASQMNMGSYKFYEHMKKIGVKKLDLEQFYEKMSKSEVKSYELDEI